MMTGTETVHVVDDDEAMRESLAFLLESAKFTARVYESAPALLARAHELEPGCILTDVSMPEMSGLELVARVKELHLPHPVIVLTGHTDLALAVEAMKAGAADFLEKPFEDEALLGALRTALMQGDEAASSDVERGEVEARLARLTEREREVFDAIVCGASNRAAAQELGISPRAVEIYRANVMLKMGADNLSALVRMAMRCGQA
jgi:two-component system response regulator FixJ